MTATLVLVVGMYIVLAVAGWCVLAPFPSVARSRLLPAAPLFGAAVIAAVTSTTTRWLSVPQSLIIVAAVLVGLVALATRQPRAHWRPPGVALVDTLLCPLLTVGGAAVASIPTMWVGDNRPAAGTIILDQFYYASTASYLTDNALFPGPYWNPGDWAGSAPPALGPVVDVIANHLRYGQASVASALSFLLGKDPSDTVTPISILLLTMVGSAVYVAARLLGIGRLWSYAAIVMVSSSFYLTTQSLEGKNDGLLGLSLALLALSLSVAVLRARMYWWPLVATVSGLAAIYSEFVLILAAPVALLVIFSPRREILGRLNTLGGAWALGAMLVPFAWLRLAQSARIGGRFSQGSTPFDDKHGLSLLRAALGIEVWPTGQVVTAVSSVVAMVLLLAIVGGVIAAVVWSPARGAVLGVLLAGSWLTYAGAANDAGNLAYRTVQLSYAFVLLAAVLGWDTMLRRRGSARRSAVRRVLVIGATCAVVSFSAANLATAATHLPRERVLVQHVPAHDLEQAKEWVHKYGADNVSVVVPRVTDLLWLSLALRDAEGVGYPVIPAIYLGNFPRWDGESDLLYIVGSGATVMGDAVVLEANSRFQLVRLGPSGSIIAPFQPTFYWARPTYMRGVPCARNGAQALLIRGSATEAAISVASKYVRSGLQLSVQGAPLTSLGTPKTTQGWRIDSFNAPRSRSSVLTIEAPQQGNGEFPVQFGGLDLPAAIAARGDTASRYCAPGLGDRTDGYGVDLTQLLPVSP